jgi:lipopolysaccharide/colanic/teichoic acid biosynthesis glycosyltransferase
MDSPSPRPDPIDVDPLKAAFDRAGAVIALLVAAPLLALTGLAILIDGLVFREDRGTILHREPRISAGRPFSLFKFRTMRLRAVRQIQEQGLTIKTLERQDRGHTRVGRFLRQYYLDELPQLLNILRGEMSFVGPRPPAPAEYEQELSEGNVRKKLARAGLVGLQQINKGRTYSFDEEIALDYAYIARAGAMHPLRRLVYDTGIILRSIRVLLRGQGL